MNEKRDIYLDNSATTRCFPEVAALMNEIFLEDYGNPSSMHHRGVTAERRVAEAKKTLAGILKVRDKNLYFTSCGTESDNLAIIGGALAAQRRGKHLITTVIEHPAVLEAMKHLEAMGFEITRLGVDSDGLVSPEAVAAAVRPDTILVSVMHTNNEIGAVQPIAEIGAAIKAANPATLFHVDAVQGFGKALILPKRMYIDLLAASGHKIHGPKGMGFLYVADGVRLEPILFGGGQQDGLRSGTLNVPGIAGMALAAKMLCSDLDADREKLFAMKNRLIERLGEIPDVCFNGRTDETAAPHILSVRSPHSERPCQGCPGRSPAPCPRGQGDLCVCRQCLRVQQTPPLSNTLGNRDSILRDGQFHPDQSLRHEHDGGNGRRRGRRRRNSSVFKKICQKIT